jgi:hypothetical protein
MNTPIDFVFFLIAAVLFALAAFGVSLPRVNFLAAGLLFFTLPFIHAAWPGH